MADIQMCSGGECPKKDTCYRCTAPTNPFWQAMGAYPQDGTCQDYWPNEKAKEKR